MNAMTIDLLLTLMIQMMSRAAEFGALITKARSEGRDVTEAELDALAANDDLMRAELQKAINEAKAKQP
jgi:hypothetical protein